jgi:hypothetical protein
MNSDLIILREEHRLKAFENKLGRIFGTKLEEVTEGGTNCLGTFFVLY